MRKLALTIAMLIVATTTQAKASDFTWEVTDPNTNQPVEILQYKYFCTANKAVSSADDTFFQITDAASLLSIGELYWDFTEIHIAPPTTK